MARATAQERSPGRGWDKGEGKAVKVAKKAGKCQANHGRAVA